MRDVLDAAMPQLVAVPILLPLAAAAFMLLFDESRRQWKAGRCCRMMEKPRDPS